MNSFHSLKLLTPELNRNLVGARFVRSSTPGRQLWEGVLSKDGNNLFLFCATIPQKTVLYVDSRAMASSGPTVGFFDSLHDAVVAGVEMPFDDRVVDLVFEGGRRMRFILFGPSANIHLLDAEARIVESFRQIEPPKTLKADDGSSTGSVGDSGAGVSGKGAGVSGKGAGADRSPGEGTWSGDGHDIRVTSVADARRLLLGVDPRLPRGLLDEIILQHGLQTSTRRDVIDFGVHLSHQIRDSPQFRLLDDGRFCLFNEQVFNAPTARAFEGINELIRTSYLRGAHAERLASRRNSLLKRLQRERDAVSASLSQTERKDITLQRADRSERFGHLLLAHAHLRPEKDANHVVLPDIYDAGAPIEIPIQPGLGMAENAKLYYQKSAGGRQQAQRMESRRNTLRERQERIKAALSQMEKIGSLREWEAWVKGPGAEWMKESGSQGDGEGKPFRILTFDGFDVWIGKHAKSNEAILRLAHKEDIWLHARHVGGSHVLIRCHAAGKVPSKETIARAASFAAWHSKARGSALAPVIWTKRKYVVKPRGAAPGQVKVMQENVVDVVPRKTDDDLS